MRPQRVRPLIRRALEGLFDGVDVLIAPSNLTGMPASSVPAGTDSLGLPNGIRLMGPIHYKHAGRH